MKRAKRRGLARNAALARSANAASLADRPALERLANDDPDPMVRDAAEWALRQPRLDG